MFYDACACYYTNNLVILRRGRFLQKSQLAQNNKLVLARKTDFVLCSDYEEIFDLFKVQFGSWDGAAEQPCGNSNAKFSCYCR